MSREQASKGRARLGATIGTLAAFVACLVAMAAPSLAAAEFQIAGFSDVYLDGSGEPTTQAGGRPVSTNNTIDIAENEEGRITGRLKEAIVETPLGLVGDPTKTPTCTPAELATVSCPTGSQIGIFVLYANGAFLPNPLYNMVTREGQPARFGTPVLGGSALVYFDASVRPDDYGINVTSSDISHLLPIEKTELKLWGVPADPAHDGERGGPAGVAERAFLSMPTNCERPMVTRLRASSWEEPDVYLEDEYVGPAMEGCGPLEFDPDVRAQPVLTAADTPTGYTIEVSQTLRDSADAIGTSHLDDAVVSLPEGVAINPAAADGLDGCPRARVGMGAAGPVTCPESSKVGEVRIDTPLLTEPLVGPVYQAAQEDNPFGSMLGLYMVAESERFGIRIKLAGEVEADPVSGRLTTTFEDNPQMPFSKLTLKLKGGSRAVLVNPPTCGTKTTEWSLTPWARPAQPLTGSDSFEIDSGPNGSPCPASESSRGFGPGMTAGTESPVAGAQTPFVMRLTRDDGEQEMNRISTTLPEGLIGKVAGKPYCPEDTLAGLSGDPNTAPGTAAGEISDPACPAASLVGRVTIGAGAGPMPYYLETGRAYLAGPYKGAPLSLAFVVPAVAGPLDLGNVLVRAGVQLDPRTAQLTVSSDEFPTILEGIPLRLRDLRLIMDGPDFMLNPTGCQAGAVEAEIGGTSGSSASLSERFQVGDCAALGFRPRLSLRLYGGARRGAYQGLRAVVRPRPGDANIGRTVVRMPRSAFLAQEHLQNICTRVQFAAEACPKSSVYGRAIAYSPLVDYPLRGNVYLRSSSNTLPDLVADLRGPAHQPIRIELVGRVDSVRGALRNTFDVVPDAPVSYFRLQLAGGSKGLIVNSTNICRGTHSAAVRMDGHNGRRHTLRTALRNPRCAKLRKRRQAKRASHARAKRAHLSAARQVG